ncbi:dsDNA nuclease domain-containing protein [Spirillospora sp. CA-294931]|uniref:dsDNA nuclease domain-containing protein n=1 Tax=Spirillospora sp. CA-294931 TaxID=3240042 RepID=UPI003D8AD2B1
MKERRKRDSIGDQLALNIAETLPQPDEDGGTLSQANFRYQAEIVATWCFGLLEDDAPLAVICEYLEDFLAVRRDGTIQLVSVKHREPNSGAWSLFDLCGKGGLAHLFDRWARVRASGREVYGVLATNAGYAASGDRQPAKLEEFCVALDPDGEECRVWAKYLARQFLRVRQQKQLDCIPTRPVPSSALILDDEDELVVSVCEFVKRLTLLRLPGRDEISASTIHKTVMPYFREKGWDERDAVESYERVVGLAERASRACERHRLDTVRLVALLDAPTERRKLLASRLIAAEAVRDAFVFGGNTPLFPSGTVVEPAPGGHLLRSKLVAGGLSVTHESLAERCRSAWYTTWRQRLPGLAGDAAILSQVEAEVLELVLDAQDAARRSPDQYGRELFNQLRRTLSVNEFRQRAPIQMNDQHALGVAFTLCDQCYFGFTPDESET